jgi:hypothetical protein
MKDIVKHKSYTLQPLLGSNLFHSVIIGLPQVGFHHVASIEFLKAGKWLPSVLVHGLALALCNLMLSLTVQACQSLPEKQNGEPCVASLLQAGCPCLQALDYFSLKLSSLPGSWGAWETLKRVFNPKMTGYLLL